MNKKRGMDKQCYRTLVFIISLMVVYTIAFIGSSFTTNNIQSSWYLENKPSFTPPNFVFPIVWSILYFLIVVSLYFSWIKSNKKDKNKIAIIFGINLFANSLWSFLFFDLQRPLPAFIDLIVIFFTIIAMIFTVYKIDRKAAWLLVPYLIWVGFAGILNFYFVV